jgi:outer membrane protein OmpA-like peptidoglycan-associated protein
MNLKLFALVGIFLFVLFAEPANASCLDQGRLDDRPNYVVIGAFRVYKNAIRFTARAHKDLKMDAKFELNPYRKLYYVYVLSTDDQSLAINEARRLRLESEFTDTWVYFGALGDQAVAPGENNFVGQDINPVTAQKIGDITKTDDAQGAPGDTTSPPDSTSQSITSGSPEEKMKSLDDVSGKHFLFKVFRAIDSTSVDGDVDAIDTEKTKKIGTYKANVPVSIPKNNLKAVSFVCEVFGYRKIQRDIDYNNPEGDGISKEENGAVVVPFELMRLQKGDIAVMYNVYFFKDASIMRPESRYEVSSLLDMLNENNKYKIRLHGHTNGNAAGRIISMRKDSKNFFSLTDTKDGFGSAKDLSEQRADAIRRYLVSNGVDQSRIEIKAWGGKRAIHDKNSARAQENVRVEVEILEN